MLRAVAVALLVSVAPVAADPRISQSIIYYTVTGNSFADLRRQMASRGPNGYWGFTRWWIEWSARCAVEVEITIRMPQLDRRAALSAQDRRIWDQMVDALMRHEMLHAQNGIGAAREIKNRDCRTPHQIIDKWSERDRLLDRQTRHGAAEGVWLPN